MGIIIRGLAALIILLGIALSIFSFFPQFANFAGGDVSFNNTFFGVVAGIIMIIAGLFIYVLGSMIYLLREIRDNAKNMELGLTNINWGLKNLSEKQDTSEKSVAHSAAKPEAEWKPDDMKI